MVTLKRKALFSLPGVAVLAILATALALAPSSAPAEAHLAQYHINKGESKSYWVYPSPEPISVYYHPKSGDPPTQLKANAGFWVWNTGFPDVTIDVYVSSGTPGREGWGFVDRLYINEAQHGDKSFPLWLGAGATYKFDIKRKWAVDWAPATVVLTVRSAG